MTTLLTRPSPDERIPSQGLRFVGRGRGRRPLMAVGSLALMVLCPAVFTSLYLGAGRQVAVLAVAHDVPQGGFLTASDLAQVRISFSTGLSPVPVGDIARVIGHRASVALVAGTLLDYRELLQRDAIPRGDAVVGVAAQPGELPAGGVRPGDLINIIFTGTAGSTDIGSETGISSLGSTTDGGSVSGDQSIPPGGIIAQDVTVSTVAEEGSAGSNTTIVSVVVPSVLASLVAQASAAEQAAIALVGPGS